MNGTSSSTNVMIGAINWRTTALIYLLAAGIIVILSYLVFSLPAAREHASSVEEKIISTCIETYRSAAKPGPTDVDALNKLSVFCYNSTRSQLLVDEENIRKDNFVFQRYENIILLLVVVSITLSGVALAGLQLWASYKLAVLGRGELSGGGEVSYSKDAVSFKSSVVGLVILFISFAFFIVFVHDVYNLKETTISNSSGPGIVISDRPILRSVDPAQGPNGNSQVNRPPPVAKQPEAVETPSPSARP